MARSVQKDDSYLSKVLKHIPSEIVLAYVTVEGILKSTYHNDKATLETALWYVSLALVIITPLWLYRVEKVHRVSQLLLSTLSVVFWMFAIGGPFQYLPWYRPALGSIALPFYTLLTPIITGRTS
ncbi:MAG: hypothetical protein D6803_06340 [Anaerolineae bacterium]|nr:MAG: hypothetical protein D6803_06340 [Anaerolineae bacterium]